MTDGEREIMAENERDARETEEGLAKTIPDDYIRASRFVVVLNGDGAFCRMAEGWDAMVDLVMDSLWDGDELPDYLEELKGEIDDADQWSRDDYGEFCFTAKLGEMRVTIYRIQD